jgi:hypothetical protein
MIIPKGSINVTTYFKFIDPTTGAPETGLDITGLDATYVRDGASAVKADLTALAAANSAHSDNKGFEVDGTNCPGLYRIDWPDAAFISGVSRVQLCVNGAAIDPAYLEVELVVTNVALESTIDDPSPDGYPSADKYFTLVDGPNQSPADDDMYKYQSISIYDVSGHVRETQRIVAYTASLRLIEVDYPFTFPIDAGDEVTIWQDYNVTAGLAATTDIAAAVLDANLASHRQTGSVGEKLNHNNKSRW